MGLRVLVAGTMAAMLASASFAQTLDMARVEIFRSILQANDCALTEAEAEIIFPSFDFTRDETKEIVGALVAAGDVRLDGNTLTLVDGSCGSDAGDAVAELLGRRDVQQFIAIMAENECAMTEAEGEQVFTARGMSKAQVSEVIGPMIGAGMASFDNGTGVLSIDGAYCSASVNVAQAPEEAPLEAPQETPVELPIPTLEMVEKLGVLEISFLTVVEQNGCALNIAEAEGLLAQAGVRMDQAYRIVDGLIADGNASLSDNGALVTFNPVLCGSEIQPVDQVAQSPVTPASPQGEVIDGFVADREAVAAQMAALQAENEARIAAAREALRNEAQLEADPRAGVLAMLALNGCEVTQSNAADMIASAGLDYSASMRILTQMMGTGEATSPDGGQTLQVSAPLCVAAASTPQTPREIFIDLIKQNNCSVTAAEFNALLPVDGLDASAAFAMINELEAEGVISLPATRDVVTLSAEMCR